MIDTHLISKLLNLDSTRADALVGSLASIQIDRNAVTELSFFMDFSQPSLVMLWNLLLTKFPHAQLDGLTPSNISVHPEDGVSYLGDSIVVDYANNPAPSDLLSSYGVPEDVKPYPAFKIKYNLLTLETTLKLYDTDTKKYTKPNTPEGTIWGEFIGVGRQFSSNGLTSHVRDFYYMSSDRQAMREWLGEDYPEFQENFKTTRRGYAISTDHNTGRIVNTKRHIYVRDPALLNIAGV